MNLNERIKELAKEAAIVYQKTLPPATHTTPLYLIDKLGKDAKDAGIEIISDGFCEKFAELIVAECMEVFSKDLPEPGDGKMLEVINRVCNVAEHFGVEN